MERYNHIEPDTDNNKIHFAVIAIEATAKRMNLSPEVLLNRLNNVNLLNKFIFGCYDTLHSESIDAVAENVEEALLLWEKKGGVLS
ncbi:MAG: DUF3791 domain-containing protein [Muribaculaceae bacterium]|nr:DUF3791 domain-containing protein [Muribaculaceae bacterium]